MNLEPRSSAPLDPHATARAEVLAVIPARYGSARYPAKVLADLGGRPVLAWVIRAASQAQRVGAVLVATDHEKIAEAARAAGAEVVLTRADHATGTDRIGEAIEGRSESIILNVQGDEPLVPPTAIDRLVELLDGSPNASVSTLACRCRAEDLESPNVVKVVRDSSGHALYFSRAAIPGSHPAHAQARAGLRHVGLYGFRRPALEAFLRREAGALERQEGLEQLRFLEAGERIVVGETPSLPPGVDTPEDLERCRRILQTGQAR